MKINYSKIIKIICIYFIIIMITIIIISLFFIMIKKIKYNIFNSLYKIFEITLLVSIFVQKYEISPLVFLVTI